MVKNKSLWILILVLTPFVLAEILFFSSCHYYRLEKDLKPDDAEFFSKVRYIITQKEKRTFLELSDSEKKDFREEFWEKRDPYPLTEENEFKDIYFERIEKANDLFISEGREGWATDRGRIYILYGPPTTRRTDNSFSLNNLCREIWYYGNFPVLFVDEFCVGQYKLATFDFTPIYHLNLKYMSDLALGQSSAFPGAQSEELIFDYDWEIKKISEGPGTLEGMIGIHIPYANLWFKEENNILFTIIHVRIDMTGIDERSLWAYEHSFKIETDEDSLRKEKNKEYHIEIPFRFNDEKVLDLLRKGENRLIAVLQNTTSGIKVKKVLKFKL